MRISGKSLQNVVANSGMLIIFVLLYIVLALSIESFFTWRNSVALALSVASVGMVACTMLFCLASGDFDLSVESIVACSGVLAAVVTNDTGSIVAGVLAGIAMGAIVGLANGCVIAKLKINALITTLATMQIVRGLALIVSGGRAVSIQEAGFDALGRTLLLGVPTPIWITVGCFTLFGILLNFTPYGRNALAIGGNEEATRLAGVAVARTKILIFTIQGMMAGFAGVILASRLGSGQPNTSAGFSLDVISACVLGGVSLTGGVGTITGCLVGVLIMGMVQNAMNLQGVETFYQYVVRGLILLAAVLFDRMRQGFYRRA